jgi:hypothetical protein
MFDYFTFTFQLVIPTGASPHRRTSGAEGPAFCMVCEPRYVRLVTANLDFPLHALYVRAPTAGKHHSLASVGLTNDDVELRYFC